LGGQRLIDTFEEVIDREAPLRQGQRYRTAKAVRVKSRAV